MRGDAWRTLVTITLAICALTAAAAAPAMAAPPANDNFANATTLASATTATIAGTNVEATNEAGEDNCCWTYNSVWYRWTAPKTANYRVDLCASGFNTHLKVLTGTAVNALEKLADNGDDPGCGGDGKRSRLTFVAFAGQQYKFQIGSDIENQTGTISGSLALVSPANDFFADTITLAGTSAAISGTTVDATEETGEPNCCFPRKTIWYRWTSPKTGNYRVDLCASGFNTHLKVLTGTAVNALEEVADNGDDPGCGTDGTRSRLTFIAFAGQRYEIQIGSEGDAGAAGTISGSLALVSPANDFFADASDLGAVSTASFSGTNVDATTEAGEPLCCFTASTVWYRWTAPATGSYTVATCGSDFNTHLRVARGTTVGALESVADNNDTPGCGTAGDGASITFTAGANTTYFFQVGSAAPPRGTITGSIKPAPTAPAPTTTPPTTTPPTTTYSGPSATKTSSDNLASYGLSAPKSCVQPNSTFTTTLSVKRKKRKGNLFVKVTRVDFSIDGSTTKVDRKAPFRQRMTVFVGAKRGGTITLRARAYIKVRRGKPPKKSVKVVLKVCAQ